MSGNFAIKGGGDGGVGRLMANAILNFHFDFLNTSLIQNTKYKLTNNKFTLQVSNDVRQIWNQNPKKKLTLPRSQMDPQNTKKKCSQVQSSHTSKRKTLPRESGDIAHWPGWVEMILVMIMRLLITSCSWWWSSKIACRSVTERTSPPQWDPRYRRVMVMLISGSIVVLGQLLASSMIKKNCFLFQVSQCS